MPAGKAVTLKSGNGDTSGSGGLFTINTGTAVGTNTAGANLVLNAGSSTGNNTNNGSIVFKVATAATGSGTSANSLADAVSITSGKALKIHPNTSSYTVSSEEVDIDFARTGDRIITLAADNTNFALTGSNATNVGQQGSIVIINPATGVPLVSWKAGNVWYFENGSAISIPQTANLVHIFSYYIYESGNVLITGATSFSQNT